jgi:hypothetical protein
VSQDAVRSARSLPRGRAPCCPGAVRIAILGGIGASRWLEAVCMAWVAYGARTGRWGHAVEPLR